MFYLENEEQALADRFKGDPGVHVTATGRVVPRKCELCSGFFIPADPMSYWNGGVLPNRLRAPELAAEIIAIWSDQIPDGIPDVLKNGYIPVQLFWQVVKDVARDIGSDKQKMKNHRSKIVGAYEVEVEKAKNEKDAGERERKLRALRMKVDAACNDVEQASIVFCAAEQRRAALSKAILRYALQHFGECWKNPGSRTALAHTDTFAELRNRRTSWCDAGELRGDVEPEQNRDMTPCLPPPG